MNSPDPRATPKAPAPDNADKTPLGRVWQRALLVAWAVVLVVIATGLAGLEIRGDLEALLPVDHRSPAREPLVLLRIDPEALERGTEPREAIVEAAVALEEALGKERQPLAPPANELTAWFDAHTLYLLPMQRHPELRDRLTDDAIAQAVQGIRARLTSPLFGVSGEDVRRDPLGLHALSGEAGVTQTTFGPRGRAEVGPTGDLIATDGRSAVVQLRSERDPDALLADIRTALAGRPVTAAVLGPEARRASARNAIRTRLPRLAAAVLAALVLVLGLALRSVKGVLAVLLCVGSAVALLAVSAGSLGPFSTPLFVLLAGFGCEAALRLQRISRRGWPAVVILGAAPVPLLWAPYPGWQALAPWWMLGVALVVLMARTLMPALLDLLGGSVRWPFRGFLLVPNRLLSVLLATALLGAGAWSAERLEYRGADRLALRDPDLSAAHRTLAERFFDPGLVTRLQTTGEDRATALANSSLDARAVRSLVPTDASFVDAPGLYVLTADQLELRRASLLQLDLPNRARALEKALDGRGLEADAFGEFVRGTTDLRRLPTPQAALDGPLGPWIERYTSKADSGFAVETRVHLAPGVDARAPAVQTDRGVLRLAGPVVAMRRDRVDFRDRMALYGLIQLALGAVIVWLGTRSAAVALSAGLAGLCTQSGLLLGMALFRLPVGPHLLLAFVLVGAAAVVAAGRACRAVDLQRPLIAAGLLVTNLCQVAVGLVLVLMGEPLWAEIGMVIAFGCALASGAGLFVAPGLAALLRGLARDPKEAQS